ncbi:MAG TPA: molybdopterin oxidoreductase family protein [Polyangiaceae bacterium]|nr:molybdopterin oxidoreductase family protein [Polyangiaceae bacterium]
MSRSLGVVAAADPTRTETHCPYCALQCGMTLVNTADSVAVESRDFPTNKGGLCRKGWTAAELLRAPDRLTTPLLRRGAEHDLSPASWAEAIDFVAASLRALADRYGPNSVGIFGGGGLTNEKAYTLGKFARLVLRSKNIDYNGRFCMASAAVANQRVFGIDRGLPFPLSDIPDAELILLIGANPAETMPPLMQYFEAQRANGGKLIVADPRRTATAEAAQLHLQLTPGSDAALGNGLLHLLIREKAIDEAFIAERTTGFAAVKKQVAAYWPDRVERITGVPTASLVQAARWLARAKSVMVFSARGAEQQSHGVDNVIAFTNLLLALGKAGKKSSGYGCFTGQGNGQGGREHGLKADQLPGYRKLSSSADRAHVAEVWGVEPDELPPPGLPALELFDALGERGGVRALWVMGANPVVSAPNAGALVERLQRLDLLIVSDLFLSETAAMADVVFPVTQWAEEDGTTTNLEGRVLLRRKALAPPAGVRSDLEVMRLVAEALGRERFVSDDPETIFAELGRASQGGKADYSGMTYAGIQQKSGLFWPFPLASESDTPRLFEQRFSTPDGRARFFAVEHRASAEEPDAEYPLYLTTGRLMVHYQSGAQTRRVPALLEAEAEAFVEVHPDTARGLRIADGEIVHVLTRRGRVTCKARFSRNIRMDTIFLPFHFAGVGRANTVTNDAVDPVSKIPEFKVAAARLEKPPPPHGTETNAARTKH